MVPVKICGITNFEDALTSIKYGAAAIGFVFAESKRRVSIETAREISAHIPPFITKVGVFVDEDPLLIKEIAQDCRLDLVQLHGAESVAVTEILPGRVIKAFKAGLEPPDLSWRGANLKAVLIDSYSWNVAGGTGHTFDWKLFQEYRILGFPLILAGGLNTKNIHRAIAEAKPDAIDLSSGVEQEPGIKDPRKIRDFMAELQDID